MAKSLDSLSALAIFERAAEAQSFAAAARLIGLSPSAVAKSVTRLEARLGVRLFHRNTRNLTVTEEGKILLESCQRISTEIDTIEQRFLESAAVPRGKLRVSLPILGGLFGRAMAEFVQLHPEVELDLDFSDRLVDVIEEGFDIAIRTGEGLDSALRSRGIGVYSLVIVGSHDYFARAGTPVVPADLKHHLCLHHKYPTTGRLERWPFKVNDAESDTGGSTEGDPIIPVSVAATTLEPLISMVKAGAGIACLPDFTVREYVESGLLRLVLTDHVEHRNVFRAVWPSSRYLPLKTRVFIDFLANRLFPEA